MEVAVEQEGEHERQNATFSCGIRAPQQQAPVREGESLVLKEIDVQ
jgi:hypothetical protein